MKGKPKKHEQPKSETRNKQVEECVETASWTLPREFGAGCWEKARDGVLLR
jgi:hypothetical protein